MIARPPHLTVQVPRQPAAFGRKLLFVASRRVLIDSFEPLKRAVDVAGAVMLLVIASPLMLGFAAYRKLTGQPLLTRTRRIGRFGNRYTQFDFAGLHGHRVLKRLPTLFNVLAGDASFIGPRPGNPGEALVEVNGRARLAVKPGLISPWWVRQRANIDFDDEALADREYLNTASLSADLGIALRALVALLVFEERKEAPPTADILGIRIDNLNMGESLDWIRERLRGKGHSIVCITNAHCVNVACGNETYYKTLVNSSLNLADGVGLRIAGRIKRAPIKQNVNGTDLFPRLCAMLEGTGDSVYLMGGGTGVAEGVAGWIGKHHPNTVVAGYRDGFFKPEDEDSIAEDIRRSGASLLLVAMGVPKQELWIDRNIAKTGVRVAIGVGGLFEFYSGRIPRAPGWMREVGLEWIHRLAQEPGRMWKRYLIGNWSFLARHLLYECKLYRPHRRTSGVKTCGRC